MNKLIYLSLICASLVLPHASSAEVPRFDAMYVFGDSLSDTGNDLILSKLMGLKPAIPPSQTPNKTYFKGRFSNGPVAFEYLWGSISQTETASVKPSMTGARPTQMGAISYAFGGATSGQFARTTGDFTVPGLLSQVEAFRFGLYGRKPVQRALYALWIGSNDYAATIPALPTQVVNNIKRSIQRLHSLGGRQIIVLNMPDLGLTPLAQAQGVGPGLSNISRIHNALLAQAIAELSTSLKGIKITSIDVLSLEQDTLGSTISGYPALETRVPGSSSCLLMDPRTCPDVELQLTDPFFYWDVEHPTTYIHSILGQEMHQALMN